MTILLMTISVVIALTFFGMLIGYLARIAGTLERIGSGADSLLGRITRGVQEIEAQTAGVELQLNELNQNLGSIGEGLVSIDALQTATHTTIQRQKV